MRRVAWVSTLLLLVAGLFILFYPLPAPGHCFWAWGGFRSDTALRNCAWNTSREASAMFLLPALFGLGLIVAAGWSIAILRGIRMKSAAMLSGSMMAAATVLAVIAYGASVEIPRPTQAIPVKATPPFIVRQGDALTGYFEPPPRQPGYTWTRGGAVVSSSEIATSAGPEHCGWQAATFMTIGWPPGTLATTAAQARQYIRDPRGVVKPVFAERFRGQATLPADARPTGHRFGAMEVFVSPSDQDEFIYIQSSSGTERWPRSDPMTLCQ
jgi:hypothetical protein